MTANFGIYDGTQRTAESPAVVQDPRLIPSFRRVRPTQGGALATDYFGLNSFQVAVGTMALANCVALSGSITRVGWAISASSSTGSQKAYIVHYDSDASGLPNRLQWSEEIDAVTAQTAEQVTREARTVTPGGWFGIFVPSGNAGTVTFRGGSITRATSSIFSTGANSLGRSLQLGSDGVGGRMSAMSDTTPPSDVSQFGVANSSTAAFGFWLVTASNFPYIWFKSP